MLASVRALLAGIVDYAGMFPPAKLPLEQALRNYVRYLNDQDNWMLGRFICPVACLAGLIPLLEERCQSEIPIRFSILATGGTNRQEFVANFESDLESIGQFVARHVNRVDVDVLELRLPPDRGDLPPPDKKYLLLATVADYTARLGPKLLTVYYEIPLGPMWRDSGQGLIDTAAHINARDPDPSRTRRQLVGVKLRCGGIEASAFPSPEQVAFAITACRDADLPLKFTAGLHHPFRHYDHSLRTPVHGFLNVFGAGLLAHLGALSDKEVQDIIADEDPVNFVFTNVGFRWKNFAAATSEIKAVRRKSLISFGSCSFDEPREDLRALGLLN